MSHHTIEIVARDELGSIVALITPDGVVDARTASAEIASGRATYTAGPDSYSRAPIRAISAAGGAYLYANWDGSRRNNLHDLATRPRRTVGRVTTPATPARPRVALRPHGTFWSTLLRAFGLD